MNYGGTYRNTPRASRPGAGGGSRPGRQPDRQQGAAHPGHRAVPTRPRPGIDRDGLLDRARPGISHQLLGPSRPARPHAITCCCRATRGYRHSARPASYPNNAEIADLAHAQGALVGYVHPFDSDARSRRTTSPLTNELPVDVALGKVDYYEASASSTTRRRPRTSGIALLNCGFRLPAGAGTDAMANFASPARTGRHEPGLRSRPAAASTRGAGSALKAGRHVRDQRPAAGARRRRHAARATRSRRRPPGRRCAIAPRCCAPNVAGRSSRNRAERRVVARHRPRRAIARTADVRGQLPVTRERLVPAARMERRGRSGVSICIPTPRPARSTSASAALRRIRLPTRNISYTGSTA